MPGVHIIKLLIFSASPFQAGKTHDERHCEDRQVQWMICSCCLRIAQTKVSSAFS